MTAAKPAPVKRRRPAQVRVPEYLDDEARAVWADLAPTLIEMERLTSIDVNLFAAYCTAVVLHRRAVQSVNATSVLLKGPNGAVKHPALQVVRDQAGQMASLGLHFGLSPAARSVDALVEVEVDGAGEAKPTLLRLLTDRDERRSSPAKRPAVKKTPAKRVAK